MNIKPKHLNQIKQQKQIVINQINNLENINVQIINEKQNISLSILMTTHERPTQTLFTLKSYNDNAQNNNVYFQVIIVDDSKETLNLDDYTNLEITYIYIKSKTWRNPCINYNIGIKYIKSENLILTNAETCVYGDIYKYINDNLNNNNYLVFDVFGLNELSFNNVLYQSHTTFDYNKLQSLYPMIGYKWYQHNKLRNGLYHFLTAIKTNNFKKINGFDDDFFYGAWFDDNMLVSQIKYILKLDFICVDNTQNSIIGVHQWHNYFNITREEYLRQNKKIIYFNKALFNYKNNEYQQHYNSFSIF